MMTQRCYHVHVTWIERIPRERDSMECYIVCDRLLEAYQEAVEAAVPPLVEHLTCDLRQVLEAPESRH
jgi:hypothetical protein